MQQQNKSAGDNDWMHELGVGRGKGGGSRDYQRLLSAVERVLGDVRSTYRGGANEMATRIQRCHKILSLRWPLTFRQGSYWGDSQKASSSWVFTCTPSAEELCSLLKQILLSGGRVLFSALLLNKHVAAKFTVLFLYNPRVNMSAHITNVCVLLFFVFFINAVESHAAGINPKYLSEASKGAYIADSTSSNKYWRKCCAGGFC